MLRRYFHLSLCQLVEESRIAQRRSGGQTRHIKRALPDVIADCTDNSDVASVRLSTRVLSCWFDLEAVVNSLTFLRSFESCHPRNVAGVVQTP